MSFCHAFNLIVSACVSPLTICNRKHLCLLQYINVTNLSLSFFQLQSCFLQNNPFSVGCAQCADMLFVLFFVSKTRDFKYTKMNIILQSTNRAFIWYIICAQISYIDRDICAHIITTVIKCHSKYTKLSNLQVGALKLGDN